ncbi:hypothetical protein WH47_10627 [Habropoda laboriosa]|uniref:Uncharacterized protein n=1 Tax=Habropoda laboriosa TaxID=597456 RepID=A0A0L7QLU7_9HYME|nr:hypothetical protein WH47_10627 [Habropoda laboriosa]
MFWNLITLVKCGVMRVFTNLIWGQWAVTLVVLSMPLRCNCPHFAEFFELMSTSLSKNSVIPQASSSRSWISSIFDFIWDQVSLFRLPNMPRSRRRHRTRSHSRARSHSAGSLQYEHKRRRIDYDSPQSKGTYR